MGFYMQEVPGMLSRRGSECGSAAFIVVFVPGCWVDGLAPAGSIAPDMGRWTCMLNVSELDVWLGPPSCFG